MERLGENKLVFLSPWISIYGLPLEANAFKRNWLSNLGICLTCYLSYYLLFIDFRYYICWKERYSQDSLSTLEGWIPADGGNLFKPIEEDILAIYMIPSVLVWATCWCKIRENWCMKNPFEDGKILFFPCSLLSFLLSSI